MSLSVALNNAVSGMRAAQTAMLTISTNIANANTEGYSRKTTHFASVQRGGLGAGVNVSDVRRETNDVLRRDSLIAGSELERRRAYEGMLSRVESLFGEVGDTTSLGAVIGAFRDSMQKLSEQPENTGLQAAVVQAAQKVTSLYNTMAREIQSQRLEAERGIDAGVAAVNTQIDNIDDLNRQIAQMKALGQSTGDLEDKRDLAVKKISDEMNVQSYIRDDGMMVVSTGNGRVLVDVLGTHPIDFTPASFVGPSSPFDTIEIDGFDITSEIRSGRVSAYVEMRDETLPAIYNALNQLAQSMRTNVTATGLATTDSALDPGTDTNLLFVATSTTDFLGTLQVHPDLLADPALLAGTPTIDLQIARDLADTLKAESYTFGAVANGLPALTKGFANYADSILGDIAGKHAAAKADFDYQETFAEAINTRLSSVSEVNIDEELSQLLVFQKAYSATGRVLQTASEMFDVLLNTVQ
jgi:flagellar hook-associated protein 1 FlgK